MNRFLSLFILLASCLPVLGQTVKQSGNVTPGHAASWTTNGIIQDAGTAANGFLTSVGVTASGDAICQNSAGPTSAGWQRICLGVTTAGGADMTVQNFGTASALPLTLNLNGTAYQFPFTLPGTGVIGPNTTVVGDFAEWNNITGTLLKDVTPTAAIDQLCSTNNDFLIRSSGTWQCSSIAGISAVANGPLSILGPSSALISTANSPNELLIQSGSTGTPITAGDTPTIQISRIESIVNGTSSGDGSLGAALRIDASTNNTQQLNGMKVAVYNLAGSTNDNVAIYGAAVQGGTLNLGIHAYGGYFVAEATTAGNYSVAVGTAVFNNQASAGYSSASCCGFTAFDAVAETTNGSATYMGAGIVIRGSTNAKWDVGLAFQPSAIRTADIQSDSSATEMWLAPSGTHSYGIQWNSATFSTAAIATPGFVVGPSGAITASTLALGGASIGSFGISTEGSINTSGFVGATLGFVVNGSPGLTQTCTVNQAKTLIFTLGILTGGTCNS